MKKSMILFAVLFTLLSCGQKAKVWETPMIGATKYTYVKIKKVEFYNDSTVLRMKINYPSIGGGFTFGKETYIEADGKRYLITGSDSFVLGEYTNTDPETWEKEFSLYFEPLPRNTRMFDLIEGAFDGAYTFYNIRPKGVELPVAKVPDEYLPDYQEDDEWPAMEYSEDPVTIHFKALNCRPGMNPRIDIWHFDITDPSSFDEDIIYLDDEGTYDYTCKIYYPEHMQITMVSSGAHWASSILPMMAPGKELTVLIDMNVTPDSIHGSFVGLKGYMAKYTIRDEEFDRIRMYGETQPTLAVWTAQNAKTVSELIAGHDSVVASVKAFNKENGYSDEESRRFFDYELRFFNLVADYNDSLFRSKEFLDYILKIRPACFFDDDKIDIRPDYEDVCHLFADTDIKGIVPDFCRYLYGVKQLRGGKQIKKPLIEDPYLSNLYDRISGNMNEEIAKNKKTVFAPNVHYLDLTEVAPENILNTILERYKGKTVVLDMWATWCGWCIKGHQEMAPYKEELTDKDIVFLYLTSSSSPFDQWMHYTNTVPGEHYYLTEEQDKYLSERIWGTTGVPKYAIFDAQGKQLYRQVGWAGLDTIKTEINKALSK